MRAIQVLESLPAAGALLDEVRLQLIHELVEPDSASGLARRLGLPRQRINYHLREMEREKLVVFVEERRKGNCTERIVRAAAHSYIISPALLGAPAPEGDRHAPSHLIAAAARTIHEVGGCEQPTLSLDSQVRFVSDKDRNAFAADLAAEFARLIKEYQSDSGTAYRFTIGGHAAGPAGRASSADTIRA